LYPKFSKEVRLGESNRRGPVDLGGRVLDVDLRRGFRQYILRSSPASGRLARTILTASMVLAGAGMPG